MNVGGGPVDLVGLYALAALVNFCGFFWAGGIAMRFRTIQAGPLMQMPVFLILFFAPVYVPARPPPGLDPRRRDSSTRSRTCSRPGAGFVAGDRTAHRRRVRDRDRPRPPLLDLGLPRPAERRGGGRLA